MGTKCGGGIHDRCMESPMILVFVAILSGSNGPKNKLPFNNWEKVQEGGRLQEKRKAKIQRMYFINGGVLLLGQNFFHRTFLCYSRRPG